MCTLASLQNDFFSESGYLGIRFIKGVILSFQITCIFIGLFICYRDRIKVFSVQANLFIYGCLLWSLNFFLLFIAQMKRWKNLNPTILSWMELRRYCTSLKMKRWEAHKTKRCLTPKDIYWYKFRCNASTRDKTRKEHSFSMGSKLC